MPSNPRVWLVGETNPYQSDPEDGIRFAMYPDPPESAGGRFCQLILGMRVTDYLRSFERRNVLAGKWSMPLARAAAACLSWEFGAGDVVFLLGRKVFEAFGLPGGWTAFWPFDGVGLSLRGRASPFTWFVPFPHPSGLNRFWNSYSSYSQIRAAVAARAPHLAPLLGKHALTRGRTEAERISQAAVQHIAGPYEDLLQRCMRCNGVITDSRNCAPVLRGFDEGAPVVQVGNGWILGTHFTDPAVPCRSDA